MLYVYLDVSERVYGIHFDFYGTCASRLGSQDVEPLSVEIPGLFTFGVKHVLGLNLPVVFELCLRLFFFVTD